MLSLDYDNVDFGFVLKEMSFIQHQFGVDLAAYKSSEGHYHLRSGKPVDRQKAFTILRSCKCSKDYKAFCEKVECFPIRTSEKVHVNDRGEVRISPKPSLLFTSCLVE